MGAKFLSRYRWLTGRVPTTLIFSWIILCVIRIWNKNHFKQISTTEKIHVLQEFNNEAELLLCDVALNYDDTPLDIGKLWILKLIRPYWFNYILGGMLANLLCGGCVRNRTVPCNIMSRCFT